MLLVIAIASITLEPLVERFAKKNIATENIVSILQSLIIGMTNRGTRIGVDRWIVMILSTEAIC